MRLIVSEEAKQLIIKWYLEGKTVTECSKLNGRPWSTVKSIIKKYTETGTVENQYRGGCKKIMTTRDRNALIRIVKNQPTTKTKNIITEFYAHNPIKVDRTTIYSELKSMGYRRRVLRKKVIVRSENIKKWLIWAKERLNWAPEMWNNFIFRDECSVVIGGGKRVYCWRTEDEKDRSHLIPKGRTQRRLSVMIWGTFTINGVGILLPIESNIDSKKYCQILQDGFLPVLDWFYPEGDFVFVHDNAPVHSSEEARKWMEDWQISASEWPPQSPDLNVIENVWRMMKVKLYEDAGSITTRAELVQRLQLLWRDITTEKNQELYSSLPSRMAAVIKCKSTITKYYFKEDIFIFLSMQLSSHFDF